MLFIDKCVRFLDVQIAMNGGSSLIFLHLYRLALSVLAEQMGAIRFIGLFILLRLVAISSFSNASETFADRSQRFISNCWS